MNDYKEGDEVIITEGIAKGLTGVIHGMSDFPRYWGIRLTWPGDDHSDVYVYNTNEFKAA